MSQLYSAERVAQREKMARELQRQIEERLNERRNKTIAEKQDALKILQQQKTVRDNLCPHGKKYVCAQCHQSYPRQYLDKRPIRMLKSDY